MTKTKTVAGGDAAAEAEKAAAAAAETQWPPLAMMFEAGDESTVGPVIAIDDSELSRFKGDETIALLNRELTYDPLLPAVHLTGALLFADGVPVGRYRFSAPLAAGGGRNVLLPPGSLAFSSFSLSKSEG